MLASCSLRGDRTRTLILATVLGLLAHTEAMSDKFNGYRGGGGGFIGETNRKLGKNYYLVRDRRWVMASARSRQGNFWGKCTKGM